MPLFVQKSETRFKPIVLLKNAVAEWITLADRAANWSPWKRAGDEANKGSDRNGNTLSRAERRRIQKRLVAIEKELQPVQVLLAEKADLTAKLEQIKAHKEECNENALNKKNVDTINDTGATKMAGEVIQAIITPLSWDPEELRAILGEAEFQKFITQKAEKHDDLVKWVQAEEDRFENLDVGSLGTGEVKAVFGRLKNAEKADSMIAMPSPGHMDPWAGDGANKVQKQRPFAYVLRDKSNALVESITSAIELSGDQPDWGEIQAKAQDATNGFIEWMDGAFEYLKTSQPSATKAEISVKPTFSERAKNFLTKLTTVSTRNTSKGDTTMTPEEIRVMIKEENQALADSVAEKTAEKTAEATIAKIVEKADAEAKVQADSEEQKKLDTEKAEKDAKIDKLIASVEELKGKVEKSDSGSDNVQSDPLKEAQEALVALKTGYDTLAKKFDAITRSPGAPSGSEDPKKLNTVTGKAFKFDPEKPFAAFDMDGPQAIQ